MDLIDFLTWKANKKKQDDIAKEKQEFADYLQWKENNKNENNDNTRPKHQLPASQPKSQPKSQPEHQPYCAICSKPAGAQGTDYRWTLQQCQGACREYFHINCKDFGTICDDCMSDEDDDDQEQGTTHKYGDDNDDDDDDDDDDYDDDDYDDDDDGDDYNDEQGQGTTHKYDYDDDDDDDYYDDGDDEQEQGTTHKSGGYCSYCSCRLPEGEYECQDCQDDDEQEEKIFERMLLKFETKQNKKRTAAEPLKNKPLKKKQKI